MFCHVETFAYFYGVEVHFVAFSGRAVAWPSGVEIGNEALCFCLVSGNLVNFKIKTREKKTTVHAVGRGLSCICIFLY